MVLGFFKMREPGWREPGEKMKQQERQASDQWNQVPWAAGRLASGGGGPVLHRKDPRAPTVSVGRWEGRWWFGGAQGAPPGLRPPLERGQSAAPGQSRVGAGSQEVEEV